jgi:pimeloyl-ACP methyl ester carboxylesterase
MSRGSIDAVDHHGDPGGPRVVLVHGAPDRSASFKRVLPLLGDLHVITYDRRGYGRSIDVQPPATNFADHADDLLEVLDGQPATVVGHSVGTNVVLTAAARRPDLLPALGLWEPPMAWADWWPGDELRTTVTAMVAETDTRALGERFTRNNVGDEAWARMSERTHEMLRAEGAAFQVDMASELTAPFAFEDIRSPTVIGYGTDTSVGHYDGAIRLAEILGSELMLVEGGDHFVHVSDPPAFAELVRRAVALRPD